MEKNRETYPVDDKGLKNIIHGLCDWEVQDQIYKFTLQHEQAERYRGYIASETDEPGWYITRSPIELDDENVASRTLTLLREDEMLRLQFTAYGLPHDWDRYYGDSPDTTEVRWNSGQNTIWLQMREMTERLQAILEDPRRFTVGTPISVIDPLNMTDDTLTLAAVEQKQPLSERTASKKIKLIGSKLLKSAGVTLPEQPKKQDLTRPHHSAIRSSALFYGVR